LCHQKLKIRARAGKVLSLGKEEGDYSNKLEILDTNALEWLASAS
jgi:hypothetical protein